MSKKTFFASDFHLGANARLTSRERERQIVRWLHQIAPEADAIYLVGDIFEAWFEYDTVVPRGFSRLLGTLAELRDGGLPITAFTGNHDLWMFGYFEAELDIPVHKQPIQTTINGKNFFIGHGDGLGPDDIGYKLMKKVLTNQVCQTLFHWIHPDLGQRLMHFSSQKSRAATPDAERDWLGDDKEWLLQYCLKKSIHIPETDYFVFGHRHLPIDWQLPDRKARYINLGEWMWANSYGVWDGSDMKLSFFEQEGRLIRNY
jgi:UDP-2,3-diacylglucosamine hydrolase